VGPDGSERLGATSPPLGLVSGAAIERRALPWDVSRDLLCLWTDGLEDARNAAGERFGESRIVQAAERLIHEAPEVIVEAILAEAQSFAPSGGDDRTMLVLRL
jgi:sigma-B regulation protein RsbU (phosphoserine phosphatase)